MMLILAWPRRSETTLTGVPVWSGHVAWVEWGSQIVEPDLGRIPAPKQANVAPVHVRRVERLPLAPLARTEDEVVVVPERSDREAVRHLAEAMLAECLDRYCRQPDRLTLPPQTDTHWRTVRDRWSRSTSRQP